MADLSSSCDATFEGVRLLAERLRVWCEDAGLREAARMDLELALVEAANNVVRHGYAGSPGGRLDLEVRKVPGGVEMALSDHGTPIPAARLHSVHSPAFDSESGRGLALIAACTDRIGYVEGREGNRLELFKALP
ncbi:ATP-binding protein [Novosphingobium sp. ERW19]|uniref:ATP-binding protein n=1 Tax=Novosphingobium sp. ERW19 TaxID=2726186 RepID=UPI001456D03F|nr:ATP-binding protein [Novosphingobium sp. ERW19]